MADDDRDLSLSEVVKLTRLDKNKVRALADAGYIKAWRPPRTGPGVPHRRFNQRSVEALVAVLRMSDGPSKDAALEELRRQNLGEQAE